MVVLLLALLGSAQESTPDPAALRARIDRVLGSTEARPPASLGRIAEVAALSIDYGAPAYNAGDVEGCRNFYRESTNDLLDAWESATELDPEARNALGVLREALDRSKAQAGADRQAWALRYGWDRVLLAVQLEQLEIQGLVEIGNTSLRRGDLEEAASAYRAAAGHTERILGTRPEDQDVRVRLPPLALGHALFAQGRFTEAAREVIRGLELIPEWLEYDVDRQALHGGPPYADALAALERAASDAPDDLDLQFLLAYEYAMGDQTKKSDQRLDAILRAAPGHTGARLLAAGLERQKRR